MKKWLKNSLASIFAFTALSMPSMISANECCDPCGFNWFKGNDCFTNFFVTSSTMYWKTCVDYTDYAVTADSIQTGTPNLLLGGKSHAVNIDWDWGFQLGLGYQLGCNGWDMRLNWTYFHTHDHSSAAAGTGVLQASALSPGLNGGGGLGATSATARAKVHYDTLDILFSKACCLCDSFSARSYFGARVLWLNRSLSATYTGGTFVGPNGGLKWTSDYTAGGLHAGTEFLYDVGCDFYLVADVAGSLVAGNNNSHQVQNKTFTDEVTTTSTLDLNDDSCSLISYNYELSLGAKYCTVFCGCWNIDWTLTYDFVHWSHVPERSRLVDETSLAASTGGRNGSVSFHGVSFTSIWRF